MEPRLSTSRKWTLLPAELEQQIRSVFKQNFANEIGKGEVLVAGRIYPDEILLSVGYKAPNSIKQSNFEISIGYNVPKDNVLKLLHLAVDAGASLFEQIFTTEDDQDFPRIWTEVDFEGKSIWIQYTGTNTELEAEADKILGVGDRGVARGDWDEDVDVDQIKASLGLDPDDDGDGDPK